MKTKVLIFTVIFGLGMIFQGCEKESEEPVPISSNKHIVKQLKKEVESTKVTKNKKSQSPINPENSSNQMDYIGEYFENMISNVNASEMNDSSSTQDEYEDKFTSYIANNNIGYDFSNLTFDTSNAFMEIADLAIDYFLLDEATNSVNSLIAFENAVTSNSDISQDQKVFLLSLSASLKYTRAIMKNEGIIISGEYVGDGGMFLLKFIGCFDHHFKNGFHAGMKTLVDGDNPALAAAAWVGLPGTIVGSLANGLWRGLTRGC